MREFLHAYPPLAVLIYAAVGILILAAAYFAIDRATPGHLSKTIFEEKNTAAAVVVAAALVGIALIIASSIVG